MRFVTLILLGAISLSSVQAYAFHCEANGSPLVSIDTKIDGEKYVSISVRQGGEAGMVGVRRPVFPGETTELLTSAKAVYRSDAGKIEVFEFTTASSKFVLTTGTLIGSYLYVISTSNEELKKRLNGNESAYCWVGGRYDSPGQYVD
ncbi:MAG: hypothetical protein JNJ49_16350 [Bdellovibrionaceae bacterium]|nr:hypothetical protein [Pseudobdellovibrionaceae bacterium]